MDLLASLHLDRLPEQQTRVSHLSQTLADNPDLKLGFNACCTCASQSKLSVECQRCHRVRYCSEACRERDAAASSTNDDSEEALGHSSVICSLLRLCNEDEGAEDPETSTQADESAHDRVQSEFESYPATLANILLEEGPCYQDLLATCARRKRKDLVIHVIGASADAELWDKRRSVWDAYGEALGQLAEAKGLRSISVQLIGPDCPDKPVAEDRRIPLYQDDERSTSYRLVVTSHKATYSTKLLQQTDMQLPDLVVFFNPGFSCPDYDWKDTVQCLSHGTAFIITTNTEMEGISDCQFLWDQQRLPSLPVMVAEIMGMSDCINEKDGLFFNQNPYHGSRVRQSGTMANDLFVKNSWILGGVFGEPLLPAEEEDAVSSKKHKVAPSDTSEPKTKKRKGDQNTKEANPALI